MNKVLTLLLIALLVFIPQEAIAEVSISAEINPKRATIGDRVRYTITIRGDEGEKIDPAVRLLQPEPFEVVDVEVSKERSEEGLSVGVILFTLVPFETGRLKLPPYRYESVDESGEAVSVVAEDLFLDVESLLVEGGGEPDRDVILGEAEPSPDWKEYIIPALILAAIIGLALYLFRRWKKKRDEEALRKTILTPYERAIKELEGIERDDLYSEGRMKLYFSSVSDAVRRYIEDEFKANAMEQTTYELSRSFPATISDFSESVIGLLDRCDSVKFAKVVPGKLEADEALESAFEFVRTSGRRFDISPDSASETGSRDETAKTVTSP